MILSGSRLFSRGEHRVKLHTEYLIRKIDGLMLISHRLEKEQGDPRIESVRVE